MRRNRYLMDRAMRRGMNDGRSSYGSKRGSMRNRGMDYANDYPERDSRYYDRNMSDYRGQDYHRGYEQYGKHHRPMEYEMYGIGGFRPRMNDYNDYGYDYAEMDKKWKEDLEEWCKELKKHDKFGMSKDQVLQQAKQMGIRMDKDYDEHEFITTYYMVISDDKHNLISNPQIAMYKAVDFLEDDDSKLKGAEKLSAYYYEVINAGEED